MYFHRFDVLWTPSVLILDPGGVERYRVEGYLPTAEFRAELEMSLARVDFMRKRWAEAGRRYNEVIDKHAAATVVPEAIYWRGVCRYKGANDHTALGEVAATLKEKYPQSVWAQKAVVWT